MPTRRLPTHTHSQMLCSAKRPETRQDETRQDAKTCGALLDSACGCCKNPHCTNTREWARLYISVRDNPGQKDFGVHSPCKRGPVFVCAAICHTQSRVEESNFHANSMWRGSTHVRSLAHCYLSYIHFEWSRVYEAPLSSSARISRFQTYVDSFKVHDIPADVLCRSQSVPYVFVLRG